MRRIPLLLVAVAFTLSAQERMEPAYREVPSRVQHKQQPVLMWSAKPPVLISLAAPTSAAPRAENQIGIVRQLETVSAAADGIRGLRSFRSVGAGRVRLHLRHVSLRDDQALWVIGAHGSPVAFGTELLAPGGDLWTPSVAGDTITLEWPDAVAFEVDSIAHLKPVQLSDACYLAAPCQSFPDRATLSSSIGQMSFISGNYAYYCTGGLINDKKSSNSLFLTAHHCIGTASEAASVELTWDSVDSSCNANDFQSREKVTYGATLLATSATSDVTLLRVSFPGQRSLMGWTTTPPSVGTVLRRISHPAIADGSGYYTQAYSSTSVYGGSSICSDSPRPNFLYSTPLSGRTGGGSSGAPVIIDGGYIVGQLNGVCGANPSDPCYPNLALDGSFAASYELLKPFLDPAATPQCGACASNTTTACVLNNRFKVTLRWRNAFVTPAASGVGTVIRYAENAPEINPTYGALSENVYFSMFPWATKRVEATVKVFKGVGINNFYWVFAAGLTNNEYWVTVTDTQTCQTWERYNAHGQFGNLVDFQAFPFP